MSPKKYYWLDPSCGARAPGRDFDHFVREARHWARRAVERLDDPHDSDFSRVYNVIFMAPKSDRTPVSAPSFWQQVRGPDLDERLWRPAFEQIRSVLRDFAHNWERTRDRKRAHVRIYCSTDRWKPDARTGQHFDPANHVKSSGDWEDLMHGQAFTSFQPRPSLNAAGEHPERVTIDILPRAWAGPTQHRPFPLTLSQIRGGMFAGRDILAEDGIDDLAVHMMTRLVFHEFMHARVYLRDDHPEDGDTAGWDTVMSRTMGNASGNAESLAIFGLYAGLADHTRDGFPPGRGGGFTMPREWDAIPGKWENDVQFSDDEEEDGTKEPDLKWDASYPLNGAVRGELAFYPDITGWRP